MQNRLSRVLFNNKSCRLVGAANSSLNSPNSGIGLFYADSKILQTSWGSKLIFKLPQLRYWALLCGLTNLAD
jgi:hypothetical protein